MYIPECVAVIGNSGNPPITDQHCPQYINGIACDSSGNIWTVHNWDEPHHDIAKWDSVTGAVDWNSGTIFPDTNPLIWLAVEPDASFAYIVGYSGHPNTSRTGLSFFVYKVNLSTKAIQTIATPYNNTSIPFTNGSTPLDQGVEIFALNGIALSGSSLYVTDSIAWRILVYDKGTFANTATFSNITLPNGIAVDGSGNIWVGNQHTQVSVYNSTGTLLATPITGLTDVWGLAISGSTLYVLDQGAYVIKQYTISGSSATLANTFGHQAAPGENSPLGFGSLRAIASDSSGNFVASQFIANWAGSRMVKFTNTGQFVWEAYNYEFASCLTYSKSNPNVVIGNYRNTFILDRKSQTAKWTGTGVTEYGNYFGVSVDQSNTGIQFAYGKSRCLTLLGNDFFYYPTNGQNMAIYRVAQNGNAGPALQLCSVLAQSNPGADGSMFPNFSNYPWLWSWYDPTGKGLTSIDASTNISAAPGVTINKNPSNAGTWAWYIASSSVDAQGTIWLASYDRLFNGVNTFSEVWAVPLHGFGPSGNPIYLWNDAVLVLSTPKILADANITGNPNGAYVIQVEHDCDSGMLFLGLYNPSGVARAASFQYNTFMAYAGVFAVQPILTPGEYLIDLPSPAVGAAAIPGGSGHVLIGTGQGYALTASVVHLDQYGNRAGFYVPDDRFVGVPKEPSGGFDYWGCINAELAPDGTIDIFAEDDVNGRIFWYNIRNPYQRATPFPHGSGSRNNRSKSRKIYA